MFVVFICLGNSRATIESRAWIDVQAHFWCISLDANENVSVDQLTAFASQLQATNGRDCNRKASTLRNFQQQAAKRERKKIKNFSDRGGNLEIDLWRGNSWFDMEICSNCTHHLILARKAFDTQMEIRRLLVFVTCALHLPNQPARDAFECWARLKLMKLFIGST